MKRIVENLGEYRPVLRAPGLGAWRWEKKLSLASAPGVLRVGFWGTGSAFSENQYQSNFVIMKGSTKVFVDLGTKCTLKLAEFGLSVLDIEHVVVSHSHADHAGSLEELALKCRYEAPLKKALSEGHKFPPEGDGSVFLRAEELRTTGVLRPSLYVPPVYSRYLWDETLRGGMAHSEEVDLAGPTGGMRLDHFFALQPLKKVDGFGRDAWEFFVGEGKEQIKFVMYVTPHIPDTATSLDTSFFCSGFLIDDRVMISGDTRFDPDAVATIAPRAETIFHDCQSFTGGVHASFGELKTMPAEIRKKTWLYHCDDPMRPLEKDGKLGRLAVEEAGFAGYAEPAPVFYEWASK